MNIEIEKDKTENFKELTPLAKPVFNKVTEPVKDGLATHNRFERRHPDLSALLAVLPPFLFRNHPKFREWTGLSARSVANLDCLGEGPPERVIVGRVVGYPSRPFITWLEQRSWVLDKGGGHDSNCRT